MGIRISQVDAFTNRPFAGNPAAVCVLSEPADEQWMQSVAAEMNLSETAFATRLPGGAKFNLRWFTPVSEVDLCGHATLATAHILWEDGHLPAATRGSLRDAQRPFDRAAAVPTASSWISLPSRSQSRSSIRASSPKSNRRSAHPSSSRARIASTFWSSSRAKKWSAALRPDFGRLEQFPVPRRDRDESLELGRV